MIINKTNPTNFKGFYRLPNKANYLKEVTEYIIPTYQLSKKEPIYTFVGKNPFNIGLKPALQDAKKISGYDENWVRANAKNHNLDLSVFGEDSICIVSGQKDFDEFFLYTQKRFKEMDRFWAKIKRVMSIGKAVNQKSIPKHLKFLSSVIESNRKENQLFEEFVNKRMVEVQSPYQLVEMLTKKG